MQFDPNIMLYEVMFTRENIRVSETIFYDGKRCLDCFTVDDNPDTGERSTKLWAWAYADHNSDTWLMQSPDSTQTNQVNEVVIDGYEECLEAMLKNVKP